MAKTRHLIHRHVYELRSDAVAGTAELQNQLSQLHQQRLNPVMTAVFDNLETGGKILHFDRLEIDLGSLPHKEWENVLADRLADALKSKIAPREGIPLNPLNTEDEASQEAYSFENETEQELYALLFFLQKAYLPWWCDHTFDIKKTWSSLFDASQKTIAEQFRTALQSQNTLARLLNHLPISRYRAMLLFLLGNEPDREVILTQAEELIELWNLNISTPLSKLKQEFYYRAILKSSENPSLPKASKHLYHRLFAKTLAELFSQFSFKNGSREIGHFFSSKGGRAYQTTALYSYLMQELNSSEDIPQNNQHDKALSPAPAGQGKPSKDVEESRLNIPSDGLLVTGAGVCLLHPYLFQLFSELNLLNKKRHFKGSLQQTKAIHLLHFLCFNESCREEFKLSLPKLLCAYPLEKPLAMNLRISSKMRKSVDDLLGSAIRHWSALKKTSPTGLREAFLKREGLVYVNDDKLLIRIERQSHDILLDRLPYALSFFKLPWLDKVVTVEW